METAQEAKQQQQQSQIKVNFSAGHLRNCSEFWKSLTSDQYVLDAICGYRIEFSSDVMAIVRSQSSWHSEFDNVTSEHISDQVSELLDIGVIEPCENSTVQFISPVFLVDKPDGGFRKILNLKKLNEHVKYEHFKMDSLKSACDLISKDCFMASIDLRKAYYSLPIHRASRPFLRFEWNSQLYQYTSLPNGLSSGPRVFTRVMKTLFAVLRERGCDCVFYLDDSFFVSQSWESCSTQIQIALELLTKAGFFIHYDKSVLTPSTRLRFLGFDLDSKDMKVFLPAEKSQKLHDCAAELLSASSVTIERLAQVIGFIISCFPAFQHGKLYYRGLEIDKINGLRVGGYRSRISLSSYAKEDLRYWLDNAYMSGSPIQAETAFVELFTDASMLGYGVFFKGRKFGGRWSASDLQSYGDNINALELKAAHFALLSLKDDLAGKTVCLRMDNTTAVSYINMMGGTHSLSCNAVARDIWHFALSANIGLVAAHIPGKLNVEADLASRDFSNPDTELTLDPDSFSNLCKSWGFTPDIDMFASYANNKVQCYVSWKADPYASYVDAFTLNWSDFNSMYVFPPFSIMGRILCRLRKFKGKAIVIFPQWKSQYWYAPLVRLLSEIKLLPLNAVQLPQQKLPTRKTFSMAAGLILPDGVSSVVA